MDTIKTGGPASPFFHPDDVCGVMSEGMTLRDYFAAKAMNALVAQHVRGHLSYGNEIEMAKRSYEIADAMLAARGA